MPREISRSEQPPSGGEAITTTDGGMVDMSWRVQHLVCHCRGKHAGPACAQKSQAHGQVDQ